MPPFIGNAAIGRLLAECRRRDTLHHAYTFAGIDGVGKKRLALQLAKSLNCAAAPAGLDACDACVSCRKVDSGSHPDVQVIAPETKVFKIDQVRALIQEIYYLPFEGRRRVFILDDADRMNEEAANALLKTLEEPPESSSLILITANLYALLPTIRSRTQVLKFQPIPVRELEAYLREQAGLPALQAAAAARLSGGSLGLALSLDMEAVAAMQESAFELLVVMAHPNDAALFKHLADAFPPNKSPELMLQILISILRDLVIMDFFQDRDHVMHNDRMETLKSLRAAFSPPVVEYLLREVEELYRKRHLNLRLDTYIQNAILRTRALLLRRIEA
ncbi:MAG TPA: DNA polymerase III subunit delta' [Acidobacteriota bacterium]|nr:DNA polymerase III subunit delta' [Acidobacteriota bacterium]HQG93172.1 DNA polymerase III subunit delta' [Acidobacteriota bacterium]HQK87732.1 DNA polymerase III subunit delta' [Acidobacteriota bacterium]